MKRSLEHFKIRFQSLAVDFDIRFALSFPSGSPEARSLQALHFLFYKTVNIRVRNLVGIRHEGLVSTSAEPFLLCSQRHLASAILPPFAIAAVEAMWGKLISFLG